MNLAPIDLTFAFSIFLANIPKPLRLRYSYS